MPDFSVWSNRQKWLIILALALACFALRIAALERKPLHFDEGNNVYFGSLSLPELLQASAQTADTDPPAHRYVLGAWMRLAGAEPFSIRLFSVFCGVISLAALWQLSRALGLPWQSAALAAAIWSISPYVVDYSQEAKGYAFAALCSLLGWLMWLNAARGGWTLWRAPGYALAMGLMFAAHYYTAPVFIMHWAWRLATARASFNKNGFAAKALLAQGVSLVPSLVWMIFTLPAALSGARGLSNERAVIPVFDVLTSMAQEMSMGRASDGVLSAGGAICLIAAGAGGLIALRKKHFSAFAFAICGIIPLAFACFATRFISFFYPRFLMYLIPQIGIALAGAGAMARKPARAFRWLFAALIALMGAGLIQQYRAVIDPETDYRSLIAQIRPALRQNDRVAATYIWMRGMFQSYAPRQEAGLRWIKDDYSDDETRELSSLPQGSRVWLLNFRRNPRAPDAKSAMWLRENAAYAGEAGIAGTQAQLFVLPQSSAPTQAAVFDGKIELRHAPIQRIELKTGEVLSTTLIWRALETPGPDNAIFAHLRDASGKVVAQRDGEAVNGLSPMTTWRAGRDVTDQRALLLSRDLPAGEYSFVVGIYHPSSGQRLQTQTGADAVELARFTLIP